MAQDNSFVSVIGRWTCALFLFCLSANSAAPQKEASSEINGVYNGTYTCMQGPRTLTLTLTALENDGLLGLFTFYVPPTSHDHAYSYKLTGSYTPATQVFTLTPSKWVTPPATGYSMVGLKRTLDRVTGRVSGKVTFGACKVFEAVRDPSSAPSGPKPGAHGTTRSAAASQSTVPFDSNQSNSKSGRDQSDQKGISQAQTEPVQNHFNRLYYCQNETTDSALRTKHKDYWSDVFATAATAGEVTAAWHAYLTATYHLSRSEITGACGEIRNGVYFKGPRGTEALAREKWQQITTIQRADPQLRPEQVEEHAIIITNWTD